MNNIFVSNSLGNLKSFIVDNKKLLSFFDGNCFFTEVKKNKATFYLKNGEVFFVNERGLVDLELFLIEWQPKNVIFYLESPADYQVFLDCMVSLLPFTNIWLLTKQPKCGGEYLSTLLCPSDLWRYLGLLGYDSLKNLYLKRFDCRMEDKARSFYLFGFLNEDTRDLLKDDKVSREYQDELCLDQETKIHYERMFKNKLSDFNLSYIYKVHEDLSFGSEKMNFSEEYLKAIENLAFKKRHSIDVL